jgi:hypothetical protein
MFTVYSPTPSCRIYIGMGQVTDSPESERRGWRFAMQRAQAAHNQEAIRDLQSIAPYAVHLSPEYSDTDVKTWEQGNDFSERHLLAFVLNTDLSKITRLERWMARTCPVAKSSHVLPVSLGSNSQVARWPR